MTSPISVRLFVIFSVVCYSNYGCHSDNDGGITGTGAGTVIVFPDAPVNPDIPNDSPLPANDGNDEGNDEEDVTVEAVIAGIAEVIRVNPATAFVPIVEYLSVISGELTDRTLGEMSLIPDSVLTAHARTQVFCNSGGSYFHDALEGSDVENGIIRLLISDCHIDGAAYDGTVRIQRINEESVLVHFDSLSISKTAGLRISITAGQSVRTRSDQDTLVETQIESADVSQDGISTVFDLNRSDSNTYVTNSRESLDISFFVFAPWSQRLWVNVQTLTSLTRLNGSRNYIAGFLRVNINNAELAIDLDTGDPDTYSVTLTHGDGVVSKIFTWTESSSFICSESCASQ